MPCFPSFPSSLFVFKRVFFKFRKNPSKLNLTLLSSQNQQTFLEEIAFILSEQEKFSQLVTPNR